MGIYHEKKYLNLINFQILTFGFLEDDIIIM